MKRLFQSNGNGAHRKSAIDSDLLRILVPPVICVVICCTFFVGASWAWFTDSATCGVEDIKNVTVTEIPAVSSMLLAPVATASPEPTPAPEATASPEPTPAPEATASPEPTPTEDPTPTAAPTTEPAPETSVSPESTPTEAPTPTAAPTTENAEGQEQSEAQTSAPASQG